MQQLLQFMGIECYPIAKDRFYCYKLCDIGGLEVDRHVVTHKLFKR